MVDYARMNEKFKPINQLLLAGKPKLALEKLNYMWRQGVFSADEQWRVYQRQGDCYFALMEVEKSTQAYWQCLTHPQGMPLAKQQEIYSNYLFALHYVENITDEEMREKHIIYNQLYATIPQYKHKHFKHDKIRIGYLADRFDLNVVSLFTLPLLTRYDRSRFAVYIYSLSVTEDSLTDTLKKNVSGWNAYQPNIDLQQVADRIYKDEIDILFDLAVHTVGGKTAQVMGRKPAPIQIAGIGYMSTSGLKAVDYFLTDVYVDPPGEHDADFSEKLIRLPHSHFCYTPMERARHRKTDYKMHNPIVFGSFNNIAKINESVLILWKRVLDKVPNSKLLIKNSSRRVTNFSKVQELLNKLRYLPAQYELEQSTYNYMDRYMDIDIALDTYPYVGGTSTCDALFCGVPVITRCGTRHGNRFGYSLLKNVGVGELAAFSDDEYVNKAVALAEDKVRLQAYRDTLGQRMLNSPLMDTDGYVQAMEKVYKQIYSKYKNGKMGK